MTFFQFFISLQLTLQLKTHMSHIEYENQEKKKPLFDMPTKFKQNKKEKNQEAQKKGKKEKKEPKQNKEIVPQKKEIIHTIKHNVHNLKSKKNNTMNKLKVLEKVLALIDAN